MKSDYERLERRVSTLEREMLNFAILKKTLENLAAKSKAEKAEEPKVEEEKPTRGRKK